MGCDIHAHTEVRNADGKWVCTTADTFEVVEKDGYQQVNLQESPDIGRDYWLFALLHDGLRGSWDSSFQGKGFPEDASSEVEQDYTAWDTDAHSPSYLTLKELKEKAMELLVHPNDTQREPADSLTGLIYDMGFDGTLSPDDVRIVFWFDN